MIAPVSIVFVVDFLHNPTFPRGASRGVFFVREVIEKARTNVLGEFISQNLPKENYELEVVFSDTMLKLPPLPFSN